MLHRSRNSDDEDDEDTDEEFHTHRLTTSVLDMIETNFSLVIHLVYTTLILCRTTLTVPTLTSTLIGIIVMQEQNPFMKKEYGRSSAGFGAHL